MAYDLTNLSPSDFEELTRDLLQAERSVYVESFTTGRDRGIDLRYASIKGEATIVQCKHFISSGWTKLRANLTKEVEKVNALSPQHYLLATSAGLTPQNKDDILTIMHPHISSTLDILGHDDIQNLLLRHRRVAQNQFKLWLASTDILERLISNASFVRTDAIKMQLAQRVKLYVSNESFRRAIDILSSQHVCVIAGLPGIGKTMLAQMLMLHHIEQGYESFSISSDIEEANQLFREDAHQFFYYDDFLGSSFHEGLQKNEDSRILEFMTLISHIPNKRLVMTTREYILRHAFSKYERLANVLRDDLKCVIDLQDYTKVIRGRILYNHLYFSKLSTMQKAALCSDNRYLPIITHANFSPRLIEHAIDMATRTNTDKSEVADFFKSILDNPQRLWDHAYNNQLNAEAQAILLALVFMPQSVVLQDLHPLARALSNSRSGQDIPTTALHRELRTMDGTFVSVDGSKPSEPRICFHNPAIRDYLLHRIDYQPSVLAHIVKYSPFFEPLVNLFHVARSTERDDSNKQQNRFSNLLRWLSENVSDLRTALQRTFKSESCVWKEHYLFRARLDVLLQRTAPTTESRLLDIVEIATGLQDESLLAWAQQIVRDISKQWLAKQGDRVGAAKLLSTTLLGEDVIASVREWVLEDLSEADDFSAAISLLEYSPECRNPEFIGSLEEYFYSYVESRYDYIMNEADDPDSIQNSVDEVETLARRLGLEPDWRKYKIEERIGELTHMEDDFDESKVIAAHRRPSPPAGPLAISEDRQMELLFDSLLREEE